MTQDQWQLVQKCMDGNEIYAPDLEQGEARLLSVQEFLLLSIAASLRNISSSVGSMER